MKNKILIIFGVLIVISLIGIVISGVLSTTDKTITIEKTKLDKLKSTLDIGMKIPIAPKVSAVTCDNKQCWASINQDNLIQTEFRTQKNYCSNYNQTEICDNYEQVCSHYLTYIECEVEVLGQPCIEVEINGDCDAWEQGSCLSSHKDNSCIGYTDFTLQELETARDTFVKNRLEDYAQYLIEQEDKINTETIGGGILTFEEKK